MPTAVMRRSALTTANDDARWAAALRRDPGREHDFVYGVRSTGVYCRATCPSRRPRRSQVTFFADPDAAEIAGFRACKRCRPRDAATFEADLECVRRACRVIQQRAEGGVSLAQLAGLVGATPRRLQRSFTRLVGISPKQYADACRLSRFKTLVRNGSGVTDALYDAGYSSSSRLYERATDVLGMTPAVYRRGAPEVEIHYGVAPSALGRVLIAATERGICAVYLGDRGTALVQELRGEFPRARIRKDGASLQPWLDLAVRHLEGEVPWLELPLDVRATAFQRRVWQELRRIAPGETRSYAAIAEAVGQPGAARAVGRACASNPVSLAVPCHRAVRTDGGLGGYRWGLERKAKLLRQESSGRGR